MWTKKANIASYFTLLHIRLQCTFTCSRVEKPATGRGGQLIPPISYIHIDTTEDGGDRLTRKDDTTFLLLEIRPLWLPSDFDYN